VLVALCTKVFESTAHPDPKMRVAMCNIILQRVQGYVPILKPVQVLLNEWLSKRVDTPSEPAEGIKQGEAGGAKPNPRKK
jgi:hypothetical protein